MWENVYIRCMPCLQKWHGSSVIRIGMIACDLITRILVLVISRVIKPLHVLLTVLSNMRLIITVRAELGFLRRMCEAKAAPNERVILAGRAKMNNALDENWISYINNIIEFCLVVSKYIWDKIGRSRVMKSNCIPCLQKWHGSSKIRIGMIACDLITRILVLVISRVIKPLQSNLIWVACCAGVPVCKLK